MPAQREIVLWAGEARPSAPIVRLQKRAIRGAKVPAGPVPSGPKPKVTASPRGEVESNWR